MIRSPSKSQTRRMPGVAKIQANTHMGCNTAIECWPSLNRRGPGRQKGDGMRRYMAPRPTLGGRDGSAI